MTTPDNAVHKQKSRNLFQFNTFFNFVPDVKPAEMEWRHWAYL